MSTEESRRDRYDWERARGTITAFGEHKTLDAWSKDARCMVKREALRIRLALGWDPEDAITRPKHEKPPMEFTHEGRTLTLRGWAEQSGIKYQTLWRRITHSGMTFAEALAKGPDGPHFMVPVTAFGETKPLSHWGVDPRAKCSTHTLRKRIRDGWDPEQAITQEPESRSTLGTGVPVAAFGVRMGLQDWGRLTHIPATLLQHHMDSHGLTLESTLRYVFGWVPHHRASTEPELLRVRADELQPGDTIMAVTDNGARFTVRRTTIPADDPA